MGDVTVIIPMFGDLEYWGDQAVRAYESALAQTVRPRNVILSAEETLKEARNKPAFAASTEWLCFLDADDELDPLYVEAMLAGQGDIRQPSTLGVVNGVEDESPVLIPQRPLLDGNYIVVGAFVRRELFARVGGFAEYRAFEDWELWIRCWRAGAELGACPKAVYRVHVRPDGRNQVAGDELRRVYNSIRGLHRRRSPPAS